MVTFRLIERVSSKSIQNLNFLKERVSSTKMNVNTSLNLELLHEMVEELDRVNQTKQTQMEYISDVCEKSNNILLLIEASQKTNGVPFETTSRRFHHSKETLHSLAKTVENLEQIISNKAQQPSGSGVNFESYLTSKRAKIDFLASSVRKLLALNDKVYQIGSELGFGSDSELESSDVSEGDLTTYEQ